MENRSKNNSGPSLLKVVFCFCSVSLFYFFLVKFCFYIPLPSPENPLIFYSNQTRDDLRLLFRSAFKSAQTSLDITMYSLSDPLMIKDLKSLASQSCPIQITVDPSTPSLPIYPYITQRRVKTKGLMHQKIVLVDDHLALIGSANMTTASLRLHDNLVVGIYHPQLAQFLKKGRENRCSFTLNNQKGDLFILPDGKEELSCTHLIKTLDSARTSIDIAMFTLTHPQIVAALIRAKERGVKVVIAVDFFTAKGASKKALSHLQKSGIEIWLSRGQQLLHHKMALVDSDTFIFGSTNWTKSAFKKNKDCLLFLYTLSSSQQAYLKRLFRVIASECTLAEEQNRLSLHK